MLVLERLQLREELRLSAATVINNVVKLKQVEHRLKPGKPISQKLYDQLERKKASYSIRLKSSLNEYKII
jgi:hypothetical protein